MNHKNLTSKKQEFKIFKMDTIGNQTLIEKCEDREIAKKQFRLCVEKYGVGYVIMCND